MSDLPLTGAQTGEIRFETVQLGAELLRRAARPLGIEQRLLLPPGGELAGVRGEARQLVQRDASRLSEKPSRVIVVGAERHQPAVKPKARLMSDTCGLEEKVEPGERLRAVTHPPPRGRRRSSSS